MTQSTRKPTKCIDCRFAVDANLKSSGFVPSGFSYCALLGPATVNVRTQIRYGRPCTYEGTVENSDPLCAESDWIAQSQER